MLYLNESLAGRYGVEVARARRARAAVFRLVFRAAFRAIFRFVLRAARPGPVRQGGRLTARAVRRAWRLPARLLHRAAPGAAAALGKARARRQAIRELSGLDDRMLADIGLPRGRIAEFVDARLAQPGPEAAPPPTRGRAVPDVPLVARWGAASPTLH
jgi:uncharacterized protein YjiS (DUF1127 family)